MADLDDGYVGLSDVLRLAESWGQDDPKCDIAPVPWGDGVVDVNDLDALVDHWEPIDPDLVAHWRFDETEGSIAHDSTGTYDANLMGDPIWLPSDGMINGSLQFDGIDDYVTTPPIELPLPLQQGSVSFFTWIKGGAPSQCILSEKLRNNLLTVDLEGNLSSAYVANSTQIRIIDGQWHEVGYVYDAYVGTRKLYIDGNEAAQKVLAESWQGTSYKGGALYIGASWGLQSSSFFSGLIDDVCVYNRAVTPQIKAQTFRRPRGQKGL